jgi:hypothetical protein
MLLLGMPRSAFRTVTDVPFRVANTIQHYNMQVAARWVRLALDAE